MRASQKSAKKTGRGGARLLRDDLNIVLEGGGRRKRDADQACVI